MVTSNGELMINWREYDKVRRMLAECGVENDRLRKENERLKAQLEGEPGMARVSVGSR